MARTKKERLLLVLVLALLFIFGGTYMYKRIGESWLLFQEGNEDLASNINALLAVQSKTVEITKHFGDMEKELKLEGTDSEQSLFVRKEISSILEEMGLAGKYSRITPKEPQKEEDFKIISISVDQIQCTPEQLGQLLYRLERKSKVMEVETCKIINQINDTGQLPYNLVAANPAQFMKGILSVDLQISRLVEYRKGEAPKRRARS